MNEWPFSYEFEVLPKHLDAYGHMNNAVYLELYEHARWKIITENGYGRAKVEETLQGPVILEIGVRFIKEITLGEKIRIESGIARYERVITRLDQRMVKENGDIASTALFTFGLFDLKRRKLLPPTEAWLNALKPHK